MAEALATMDSKPLSSCGDSSPSAESELSCLDILCSDQDIGSECQEDLEVHIVDDRCDEWMLEAQNDVLFEGAVVDPNTHEPVRPESPPDVGCQSYVSSTELIESQPSTQMESVDRYLCGSQSPPPKETNEKTDPQQTNTVKRVILLNPGDDPDKATAKAISDITDSLNKRAAERLAAGKSPEKETVIEITRIKAPYEGYFSRENIQAQRERFASNYIKSASQCAPASVAILQNQKGGSTPSSHTQPPQQHQHHRRKSPHLRKQMYSSSTPPCVPKQPHDLSEGCYFVSSAQTHPSSPSTPSKFKTANFSSDVKSSEARLAPGTAIYAAPSNGGSKKPAILRARTGLKNSLSSLRVSNKNYKQSTNDGECLLH
jgi:hypothetical protein